MEGFGFSKPFNHNHIGKAKRMDGLFSNAVALVAAAVSIVDEIQSSLLIYHCSSGKS